MQQQVTAKVESCRSQDHEIKVHTIPPTLRSAPRGLSHASCGTSRGRYSRVGELHERTFCKAARAVSHPLRLENAQAYRSVVKARRNLGVER